MNKQSVILEIFHGNMGSQESIKMPQRIIDGYEKADIAFLELEKKLSPEQLSLIKKVIEDFEYRWSDEIDFYFVEGFKLGVQIGMECAAKTE